MIESNLNVNRICCRHFQNQCNNCPILGVCMTRDGGTRIGYERWVAKCNAAADSYIKEYGDEI